MNFCDCTLVQDKKSYVVLILIFVSMCEYVGVKIVEICEWTQNSVLCVVKNKSGLL